MNNIRLLPVVIVVVGALFVLKTTGLVTQGHYVLSGVTPAAAAGGAAAPATPAPQDSPSVGQPTLSDAAPVMSDQAPTLEGAVAPVSHDAPAADTTLVAQLDPALPVGETTPTAANSVAIDNACAPRPTGEQQGGQLTIVPGGCPTPGDALPQLATPGGTVDMAVGDTSLTGQVLLDRLSARRAELEAFEQELSVRASLVDAAERRIEDRASTLEALEAQIASLVDERKRLEEEQFASIVSMFQTMKPKDAATIFDELEIDVLVRVAKLMSPRRLAPVLAEMKTPRAQELTVRLASETSANPELIPSGDVAALPQIVGQ